MTYNDAEPINIFMKFGFEAEKFLFNLREDRPSRGVFRFLDALSDFEIELGSDIAKRITNEFVLNMVEINTHASSSVESILKEYILSYLILESIASRENVSLVPLGSLPLNYDPHMVPKWGYLVQNSILAGKKHDSWMMTATSPLRAAGNCAGIHIHTEIETPPEFLFSTRELQDKFNLALMLTPMIAFSSSPYFFGAHEAHSMRGHRYYKGVYKKHFLNGGLPKVMSSSETVLKFVKESIDFWINKGISLGVREDDLHRLTAKKGANWNPVKWNRLWNTIEFRCLDSDRIDLDCSKFFWVTSAMRRTDLKGEALRCTPLKSKGRVDLKMIEDSFDVRGREVSILSSEAIAELFDRAVMYGTKDDLVEAYLYKISEFSINRESPDNHWIFNILKKVLETHETTSENLLKLSKGKAKLSDKQALKLVHRSIEEQAAILNRLRKFVPDVFESLDKVQRFIN